MWFHDKTLTNMFWDWASEETLKLLEELGFVSEDLPENISSELESLTWAELQEKYWSLPKDLLKARKGSVDTDYTTTRVWNVLELFGEQHIKDYFDSERLRPYQMELLKKTMEFLFNGKEQSGYIHSATSTWKTVIFWELVRAITTVSEHQRVLITVPSKAALTRAKEEMEVLWIEYSEISWTKKDDIGQVTIASVDTLRNSIKKWDIQADDFDVCISDEIHTKLLWKKTKEIINFLQCKKIGFTATPELLSKTVEELFPEKIWEYLIDEAMRDWYIPEVDDSIGLEFPESEYGKLKKQWADYSMESLGKIELKEIYPKILELFQNELKGKKMAIFMPNVQTSKDLTEYLKDNGISSTHVDGTTEDIEDQKDKFESGEVQVITSCDVLKESWDPDNIDGVINLRPTLSPAVYMQILWRALHGKNTLPDGTKVSKKKVYMVDPVSSRRDILARNISMRWVKHLFDHIPEDAPEWDKEGLRGKIKSIWLWDNMRISEIMMYYDFPYIWDQLKVNQTLAEYCKMIWEDPAEFFNVVNTQPDIFKNRKETLPIEIVSNNFFGKSFVGRERTIDMTLGMFLESLTVSKKHKMPYVEKVWTKASKLNSFNISNVRDLLLDKDAEWYVTNEESNLLPWFKLSDILDEITPLVRWPYLGDIEKRAYCKFMLYNIFSVQEQEITSWDDLMLLFKKMIIKEDEMFEQDDGYLDFINLEHRRLISNLTLEKLRSLLVWKPRTWFKTWVAAAWQKFHLHSWSDFIQDILEEKIGIDYSVQNVYQEKRFNKIILGLYEKDDDIEPITDWEGMKPHLVNVR